jgi:hypothetical protein
MTKHVDLTGENFGRLTVLSKNGSDKKGYALWECRCDCGNYKTVRSDKLKSKSTSSCGCLMVERFSAKKTTHGKSHHRLYGVWRGIKQRCYYDKHVNYNNYGGRNILMCSEWKDSFEVFYKWSIDNEYKQGLEIDRIDNYKGYSPNNCRYVTREENNNNKR